MFLNKCWNKNKIFLNCVKIKFLLKNYEILELLKF